MYTGKLAGEVAAAALKKGDTSKKALMVYDNTWREGHLGHSLARNYAVKESFIKMDDAKFNSIMHSMTDISLDEITVKSLVLAIFKANPWLTRELPRLFLTI